MSRFVIDASLALVWCFPDESYTYADAVLGEAQGLGVLVPSHWFLEVSNALLTAEKRGRTTPQDTSRAVALLDALQIEVDPHTARRAMGDTLALARTHGLTAYGAAYLEVCVRKALPLATLDRQLVAACKTVGVPLFEATV